MSGQRGEVTIYARDTDALTPVVLNYMKGKSGCNVTIMYVDEENVDPQKEYPQIWVGEKYFGGVESLGKFPLQVTDFRMMEITGEIDEPMCREDKEFDRLILFNGKTERTWEDMYTLYKKELASFWVVEEIDLNDDLMHWENLKPDERHFITMVLAFFASLDQLVMENVSINFGQEITVAQVRSHFAVQDAMESIHAEAYALLIQTYIRDRKERDSVLRSVQTMPIIRAKATWVTKYMNPETVSLAERLIGFTCLEGVQFSGAFAAIYWLKSRGLMPGLCLTNAFIARDEALHAEASVLIYSKLEKKLPESRVYEIFREAVDVEKEFICESLPVSVIGMNAKEMSNYIMYVADFWLARLGYSKLYGVKNPFGWMESISLQGRSNFFETREVFYNKANVLAAEDEHEFSLDTEF